MNKVIILGHGNPYDFKNEDGGQIKGVKVSYINAEPTTGTGAKGFLPIQVSLDPSILSSITQIPGLYEVDYVMKPGKNNKPEAVVSSFNLVQPITFSTVKS